ncbi:MAG: dephospho-CoA kinase, partial [Eggerthellaceae bacterium]
ARKAFVNPETTRRLNRLTLPRIEDAYTTQVEKLKEEGEEAVVVENSIFRSKKRSMAYDADIIIAVVAPIELRIQRAVASGWAEDDVRRRIAQQITDAERIQRSDVVFNNDGTREELWDQVVEWWHEHQAERAREKAESAEEADDEAEDANQ